MHHFGAFFKLGLQELSNLRSLNSGLLGKAKLFFVYLLLLSERWARLSNSMGDSSSLVSGGNFRCGCKHIITLISIVFSTQSLEVSLYEDTGFFDFNKFSIIDNSQVRSSRMRTSSGDLISLRTTDLLLVGISFLSLGLISILCPSTRISYSLFCTVYDLVGFKTTSVP